VRCGARVAFWGREGAGGARRTARRGATKEEEGEKEGERKRKRREKKKRRKEKKKIGKELGKRFKKFRKIVRNFRGNDFAGFFRFPGVSVIFGTVVMARRTGWRDRGSAGFPAWWPTAALRRHTWAMAQTRAVPAEFAARAPRVREGKTTGVPKGVKELSGKVLKIRMT
jgi:hypothetical protein